ncbi:MAG TPA: ATP synthase F1 subunit gamma [Candidatus Absconditabacterales bacterium]|nr:ATP synthase F1 subunit gamma [Candidatus Absconditabacterales bacterium]
MANTKLIKTKIKSITNLQKIIKALEIVSTVKLQKIKQQTTNFGNFMTHFLSVLNTIKDKVDIFDEQNKINEQLIKEQTENIFGRRLIILLTTDKGLCGSMNSRLIRHLNEKYGEEGIKENVDLFIIGKKGFDFFVGTGWNIVGTVNIKDTFTESDLNSLFVFIKQSLKEQRYAKIKIYFNYFKNVITQVPLRFKLYPLDQDSFDSFLEGIDINLDNIAPLPHDQLILEPNPKDFAASLIEKIVQNIVYYAMLNNKASEQASRMLAMKNAKDNCGDIISGLQILYNKTRQQKITQEISEIVGGSL